jgi:predicted ATPase
MAWATKLVGRGAELAELRRELQHAAAGEFRIVLLLADPGIGKTRLAREFLARSHARVVGLSARAYPLGETASFGVWSEALESQLRGLPPDEITKLCGGFLDDLAVLLHSVAAVHGSAEAEPPRLRLLDGFAVVLSNLARRASVVVFLDDAHLADASSWEALGYLAGTIAEARVLVVAAARPAELVENREAVSVLLGWSRTVRCGGSSCCLWIRPHSRSWPERRSTTSLRRPSSIGSSNGPAATRSSRSACSKRS